MAIFLVLVGVALIIYGITSLNKTDNKSNFTNVLNKTEENVSEADVKIMQLRREFAETILELQKEIIEIKEKMNIEKTTEEINGKDSDFDEVLDDENNGDEGEKSAENSVKIDEVQMLLEKGLTMDEICEKLQIGKGEVLLIKDLYGK